MRTFLKSMFPELFQIVLTFNPRWFRNILLVSLLTLYIQLFCFSLNILNFVSFLKLNAKCTLCQDKSPDDNKPTKSPPGTLGSHSGFLLTIKHGEGCPGLLDCGCPIFGQTLLINITHNITYKVKTLRTKQTTEADDGFERTKN